MGKNGLSPLPVNLSQFICIWERNRGYKVKAMPSLGRGRGDKENAGSPRQIQILGEVLRREGVKLRFWDLICQGEGVGPKRGRK